MYLNVLHCYLGGGQISLRIFSAHNKVCQVSRLSWDFNLILFLFSKQKKILLELIRVSRGVPFYKLYYVQT